MSPAINANPVRSKEVHEADRGDGSETAERISSSDHIVEEIMRGLYEGRYVPGQKLTESELGKRFGVGRGSVREAVKRLAAEGIVTLSLHRGANIRALSRRQVRDVLEIIEVLAALAARRAAEHLCAAADVKTMRDALKMLTVEDSELDLFEVGRLRDRFYRLLAQLSCNRELARLMPTMQAHMIRVQFRAAYGPGSDRRRASDYARIVEAVLAKDGSTAERAMRQHIRQTAQIIDSLPDDMFAR